MRKTVINLSLIAMCLLVWLVPSAADTIKIGFDESLSPQPNHTLAEFYSKLKTYIEAEYDAEVSVNDAGWYASDLNKYDVYILPTRYQVAPNGAELNNLANWVRNGGSLIILWHSMCWGACVGNPDPDTRWDGEGLHKYILEDVGDVMVKAIYPNDMTMRSFISPFNNTPKTVNVVYGGNAAFMHSVSGTAKFLARNSYGQGLASYNPNCGSGKLYLIGSLTCFQNSYIDTGDNKNFLLNLIYDAADLGAAGGGGGGGGAGGTWVIQKVKAKPRVLGWGDTFKLQVRVRNKTGAQTPVTVVEFYLSSDTTYDAADTPLTTANIPILNDGKSVKVKKNINLPEVFLGSYYVIAKVQGTNVTKAFTKAITIQ